MLRLGGFRRVTPVSKYQEEVVIYFDRDNSYCPTSVKIDDPFDDNFKLTVIYESDTMNLDIPIVLYFKGSHYLLGTARNIPPGTGIYFTWEEVPTAREFFEALGETIEESQTYSLVWETGFMVDETHFIKTDELPVDVYVEVPKPDILTYAVLGAVGLGVLGLVMAFRTPSYGRE